MQFSQIFIEPQPRGVVGSQSADNIKLRIAQSGLHEGLNGPVKSLVTLNKTYAKENQPIAIQPELLTCRSLGMCAELLKDGVMFPQLHPARTRRMP